MRRLLAAALVFALSWAVPVAASAHATLLSVDPHDGSTVSRRPDAVTLRFSEPVQPPVGVVVVGPGGQRVSHGASTTLLFNLVHKFEVVLQTVSVACREVLPLIHGRLLGGGHGCAWFQLLPSNQAAAAEELRRRSPLFDTTPIS